MGAQKAVPGTPTAFHVMAKPTGAACNLDCAYCFFLPKERLYPGSAFRMPEHLLDTYIRQLIEGHSGNGEVVVAFQGGEPTLMGLDFFRRAIEFERRYARPGQQIVNVLQTNGILLDDAWGTFLAEHDFLVGLSIDGPRRMHDAYRVDKAGNPSFDRVMRALRVLHRHDVRWNALTTVHAANADAGRAVYTFLRDECGATFTQFIPIVERSDAQHAAPDHAVPGGAVTGRSVTADRYGQFMIDVFEEWVRRDVGSVYVQHFDTAVARWLGMAQAGLCVHARTCGTQVALEHTGDLYSCDHYVDPAHLLGNIGSGATIRELVASPRQRRFGQDKRDTLPGRCLACDVRFACNGGCPKDRFDSTPTGEAGLNYLCAGYQRFFHHIDGAMRTIAALVRSGRPAADIMAMVSAEDARRSRNDPCPCGGGRKWKRCHGAPPQR